MGDANDLFRVCGYLLLVIAVFAAFICMLAGLASGDYEEKPAPSDRQIIANAFAKADRKWDRLFITPKPRLWECVHTGVWHCKGEGIHIRSFEGPRQAYWRWHTQYVTSGQQLLNYYNLQKEQHKQ